ETMAEWWVEGLVERLEKAGDPEVKALLQEARLYIIPNMNPDGSARGHLRTNAAGVNLNREWAAPSLSHSPEVYLTLKAMDEHGCDLALDVHGDEALPYNFIAGADGIPSWSETQANLQNVFKSAYQHQNGDFQTRYGYPVTPVGKANLGICTNALAERFGCLAMTLEMPFKDNADRPNPREGWSPARCQQLGGDVIEPLLATLTAMDRV
ncbi:MAG: carboxypeptidase family protein, partial [Pseudomonadota bacterium]